MKTRELVEKLRLQAVWLEDWDVLEARLLRKAARRLEKQQQKIRKLKGKIPGRPEAYLDVEQFYEED